MYFNFLSEKLNASETIFRQLVNHGYLRIIKYGECFPFTIGLGLFMYLYSRNELHPNLQKVFKREFKSKTMLIILYFPNIVVYKYTNIYLAKTGIMRFFFLIWLYYSFTHMLQPGKDVFDLNKLPRQFGKLRSDYKKSLLCEHNHSCLSIAAEKLRQQIKISFASNFTIGIGISTGLILLKNLRKLFVSPLRVIQILLSKNNFKIPVFFGLMPLLFHVVHISNIFLKRLQLLQIKIQVWSGNLLQPGSTRKASAHTTWRPDFVHFCNRLEKFMECNFLDNNIINFIFC
uniref:Transmembrane protein n=1 Tax=Heterorhabditis bacteriophora TaxID=37862 RepID=A0A1I7WJ89_HETBA